MQAIPAYQDYIARTQVSEAVNLLAGGKTPMAEYFSDRGAWPGTADAVMGNTSGKYTAAIVISASNATAQSLTLEATMEATGINVNIQSETVEMSTTDGGANWACTGGSVDPKFRPSACRL